MTGFLTEIGSKLADRWAALLALPGLLYLAAVTAAAALGQDHAVSYPFLSQKITSWAASPVLKSGRRCCAHRRCDPGRIGVRGPGSNGRREYRSKPSGRCPASMPRPGG